jgi:hypothetical protein
VYKGIRAGTFPKQHSYKGIRGVFWYLSEILKWVEAQKTPQVRFARIFESIRGSLVSNLPRPSIGLPRPSIGMITRPAGYALGCTTEFYNMGILYLNTHHKTRIAIAATIWVWYVSSVVNDLSTIA